MTFHEHSAANRRAVRVALAITVVALLGAACGRDSGGTATAPPSTSLLPSTTTSTAATTTTSTAAPTTTTAEPTTVTTASPASAKPTTTSTARPTTSTTATPAVTAVTIKEFMFRPNPLRIPVGTTVVWTNDDEILHTVTSGMRTYDEQHLQKAVVPGPPGFDFQLDGKGKTATFTFTQAGTFSYLCTRHPGMDAQITVG